MTALTRNSLEPLVGLKLTLTYLAADMRIFGFGPKREVPIARGPHKGRVGVVGSHALHIQAAWRLRRDAMILTGQSELYVFDGETPSDWHYEQGGSRQSATCDAIIAGEPVVEAVSVDPALGDVVIRFEDNLVLEIIPDSLSQEAWRFFEPSTDGEHLVFPREDD